MERGSEFCSSEKGGKIARSSVFYAKFKDAIVRRGRYRIIPFVLMIFESDELPGRKGKAGREGKPESESMLRQSFPIHQCRRISPDRIRLHLSGLCSREDPNARRDGYRIAPKQTDNPKADSCKPKHSDSMDRSPDTRNAPPRR